VRKEEDALKKDAGGADGIGRPSSVELLPKRDGRGHKGTTGRKEKKTQTDKVMTGSRKGKVNLAETHGATVSTQGSG